MKLEPSLIFQTLLIPFASSEVIRKVDLILMENDKITKKTGQVEKQKSDDLNHPLLPKVTSDEIDLDIDTRRDAEIAADKPPHHN